MSCSGLTSDFYMIAFKQNMSDLKWNTEYDTKSGFVFHKLPNSSMGCKRTLDRIPYFNISTSASRVQY
jgi:hypothetical protein